MTVPDSPAYPESEQSADSVPTSDGLLNLAYMAWTIIANASEGDWTRETPEWQEAATSWRNAWHAYLAIEPESDIS